MVDVARMLVVVAVDAEQFPIAAIRRIVIVIVVAMVHGQFTDIDARKFTRATPADPWIHTQRTIPITMPTLFRRTPRVGNDTVQFVVVDGGHCRVD